MPAFRGTFHLLYSIILLKGMLPQWSVLFFPLFPFAMFINGFVYCNATHSQNIQYYFFWPIGAISCIITTMTLIPAIFKLHNEAQIIRDRQDTLLLPLSYRICIVILIFPLMGSFSNFFILLAPMNDSVFVFILNLYNAHTLYCFCSLLIMYLGSYKSAARLWRDKARPTKYYASSPCCCLKSCIAERRMTKGDFRRIYFGIQQYVTFQSLYIEFCICMTLNFVNSRTVSLSIYIFSLFLWGFNI